MMGFADIAEGSRGPSPCQSPRTLAAECEAGFYWDDSPSLPPLAGSVALGLLPMLGKAPRNHASTQLV